MTKAASRKPSAVAKLTAPAGERPDLAARLAWTYLGAVLAAVVGGLIAVVAYQVVRPLACPVPTDEVAEIALTCELVWAAVLALAGFLAAYAGSLALLKVGHWLGTWLATAAGLLFLLSRLDSALEWWWLTALLLSPALAALLSAPWNRRPLALRLQTIGLALLLVIAGVVFGVSVAGS